jgi:hypothetical protein
MGVNMKELGILVASLSFSFAMTATVLDSLEQLLGVNVDERGITFQVSSNGCTDKDNFYFYVEEVLEPIGPMLPAYEHHHYITVQRIRPDSCEIYIPYGTKIFLSFEELGISFGEFHVRNPIGGTKIVVH